MHTPKRARGVLVVVASATLATLVACAPQKDTTATPPASGSPSASACAKANMHTLAAGKLTIGADDPVYEPWFVDNKPENGQGFESAVAYAVAGKLGYANSDVVWTRV